MPFVVTGPAPPVTLTITPDALEADGTNAVFDELIFDALIFDTTGPAGWVVVVSSSPVTVTPIADAAIPGWTVTPAAATVDWT